MISQSSYLSLPWWRNPSWQSILWKLSSCLAFACSNNIVRYLSGGSPIPISIPISIFIIIFFQNIFSFIFTLLFVIRKDFNILKTNNLSLYLARVFFSANGIIFWYLTIRYFPIAHGVVLSFFVGPILTLFGAIILLKEKLNIIRTLAISFSLIGAFLILNDKYILLNTEQLKLVAFFPIAAAACFTFSKLITKKLASRGETAERITIYLLIFMAPISGIFAIINWQTPYLFHMPWLLLIGLLTTYAHFAFSKAYTLADVTHLMPLSFTRFILNAAISYLAFMELPTSINFWLGLGIICLSLFIISFESARK